MSESEIILFQKKNYGTNLIIQAVSANFFVVSACTVVK